MRAQPAALTSARLSFTFGNLGFPSAQNDGFVRTPQCIHMPPP